MRGEFVEIRHSSLSEYEGEVAIEPRSESPLDGQWPKPELSQVISGTIRITNRNQEPIQLARSQHIAHIHKVISPEFCQEQGNIHDTHLSFPVDQDRPFSKLVSVDPDSQLTRAERDRFV